MIFSSDPKAQSWVGRLRKMLWLGIRWVAQQVAWLAWWDSGSGRCKHWVWGSGWWNVESQAGGNADGSVGEAVETHSGVLVVEVEAQEIVKKRIHSWVQAGCGGARGWVVGRPGSWKLVASWSPERSRSDKVNRVTNSSTRDEFHWGEHKWGGRVCSFWSTNWAKGISGFGSPKVGAVCREPFKSVKAVSVPSVQVSLSYAQTFLPFITEDRGASRQYCLFALE